MLYQRRKIPKKHGSLLYFIGHFNM